MSFLPFRRGKFQQKSLKRKKSYVKEKSQSDLQKVFFKQIGTVVDVVASISGSCL
jgi:hypothetical protein